MIRLCFSDLVAATGARALQGDPHTPLHGVSTDTRSITEGALFVALAGPNFDGAAFAQDALERGAGALLLPAGSKLPSLTTDVPLAVIDDTRKALGDLARWHRARLSARVVAITGSCGKTTTKGLLVNLLEDTCRVVASPSSFNNDVGVPHTILLADESTEVLVVELGTNAPGEIADLTEITRPHVGVVTNVGLSHLAGLGSLEGVALEKGALPASLPADGVCVLNADCPEGRRLAGRSPAAVLRFGIQNEAEIRASALHFRGGCTEFLLNGSIPVRLPLLGQHAVQNALAALAAAHALGFEVAALAPRLTRSGAARGRLQRHELDGLLLFDDTYNANPDSARAALCVLEGLERVRRRVLVMGDMLELGAEERTLHHALGADVARAGVDVLITVGPLARALLEGALEAGFSTTQAHAFPDCDAALEGVPGLLRRGDVLLVKASRGMRLDRLVERIREGREPAPVR